MKLHTLLLASILAAGATACLADPAIACVKADALQSQLTPAELYPAVASCIRDSDVPSAVLLAALGNAYAAYDAQRVSDQTATSAGNVLQRAAMSTLSDDQKRQLAMGVITTMRDPAQQAALCQNLRRIGPPSYVPTYMINHGMAAVGTALTKTAGGDSVPNSGLKPQFDGTDTWQQVLQGYMHCPAV
ncbi:MAG: hypothetical protein JO002_01035 [Burkholderiaceae bacterium]|nr:hypothetical protein [Burkholderiaceae bacterium]